MLRVSSATILAVILTTAGSSAAARDVVYASVPQKLAVTVYRDPDRAMGDAIDPDWPEGFAMISETRMVTLPPGETTIRFEGVAEGMVAVSAIVTGLPGGTIEKNRNADLLSPAALVDGTLGNRITITRTNPATGQQTSERAIVRTRADGGLVLQTSAGFEAVRCSGLPERLSFDGVPDGLSAKPIFSINTRDEAGGTYPVTLTYLASGFDWQAHYVGTFSDGGPNDRRAAERRMRLTGWLTLVNSNNQSFADAQLMAIAGRLNIESDFRQLANPPRARPLSLTCYPLGSTAAGTPVPNLLARSPSFARADESAIIVSSRRFAKNLQEAPVALGAIAKEEALGDLKLYRMPETVTVAAHSQKQVAFLSQGSVKGDFLYRASCGPYNRTDQPQPLNILLKTRNDKMHGLGMSLPMGSITLFEPSSAGDLLVGEPAMRDYASGQEIELEIGNSHQVFSQCNIVQGKDALNTSDESGTHPWSSMEAMFTNANQEKIKVRMIFGSAQRWELRRTPRGSHVKDGQMIVEITVPGNSERKLKWQIRPMK